MTYKFIRDDDNNLISVTYETDTSYRDRVELLDRLVSILKDIPTMNVLIDTDNAQSIMSDTEQLEFGETLSRNAHYFQHNKTAIVTRNENPHPYILAEAYVDGFGNIVEFDNLDEAMAWIRGEMK